MSEALAKEVLNKMQETAKLEHPPHNREVQLILEAFINLLVQRTVQGETTTITNFASFSRKFVDYRMHKNPQTNEPVPKPAHYKMQVEIKPALKDKLAEIPIEKKDKA